MTKLHFPAGCPELKPRPAQSLRDNPNKTTHLPPPLCKNAGGGKGQKKRKGLFP